MVEKASNAHWKRVLGFLNSRNGIIGKKILEILCPGIKDLLYQ
jgi:hypothetical protein